MGPSSTNRCGRPSATCFEDSQNRERGTTIVELAVAIILSSVVILGLVKLLLDYKEYMERDLVMHEVYTYAQMCLRAAEKSIKNASSYSPIIYINLSKVILVIFIDNPFNYFGF